MISEEKKKRIYEPILEKLKLYFPHVGDKLVKWYPSGIMKIVAETDEGDRYDYNPITGYVHLIRKLDDEKPYNDEHEWKKEFSFRLRECMSMTYMTQQDISEMTGISQQTLNKYISGKATPSLFNATRLAKALNCDVNEFVNFYVDERFINTERYETTYFTRDEHEWRKEFSFRLIKRIRDSSLTQQDISEMTGISQQTLSKYISGKATPSLFNATRLVKALNCDVNEFANNYMGDEKYER